MCAYIDIVWREGHHVANTTSVRSALLRAREHRDSLLRPILYPITDVLIKQNVLRCYEELSVLAEPRFFMPFDF